VGEAKIGSEAVNMYINMLSKIPFFKKKLQVERQNVFVMRAELTFNKGLRKQKCFETFGDTKFSFYGSNTEGKQ